MHEAARYKADAVKVLIEYGANTQIKNQEKKLPIDIAVDVNVKNAIKNTKPIRKADTPSTQFAGDISLDLDKVRAFLCATVPGAKIDPAMFLSPQPASKPVSKPATQTAKPAPAQKPTPAPQPKPAPAPAPKPVEQPKPAPAPAPKPVEQPKPAPAPAPKPVEQPKPAPEPAVSYTHLTLPTTERV